jgi:hypothetical protein
MMSVGFDYRERKPKHGTFKRRNWLPKTELFYGWGIPEMSFMIPPRYWMFQSLAKKGKYRRKNYTRKLMHSGYRCIRFGLPKSLYRIGVGIYE